MSNPNSSVIKLPFKFTLILGKLSGRLNASSEELDLETDVFLR